MEILYKRIPFGVGNRVNLFSFVKCAVLNPPRKVGLCRPLIHSLLTVLQRWCCDGSSSGETVDITADEMTNFVPNLG
jgi:hypothetical protein